MERYRKEWNERHKKLRHALSKSIDRDRAIELFLSQHAMVHSAKASNTNVHSFEDEIISDLSEKQLRAIPEKGNHSIAWIIWHLARIEDVTMNILVADKPPLFHKNEWAGKLDIDYNHTGNGMTNKDVIKLSNSINVKALKRYRLEVGKQTRRIVKGLQSETFARKVEPSRIQRLWDEKAMLAGGEAIANYWAKRTISGLLLMPPTRHCFLHLNEARRIKEKIS